MVIINIGLCWDILQKLASYITCMFYCIKAHCNSWLEIVSRLCLLWTLKGVSTGLSKISFTGVRHLPKDRTWCSLVIFSFIHICIYIAVVDLGICKEGALDGESQLNGREAMNVKHSSLLGLQEIKLFKTSLSCSFTFTMCVHPSP